MKLEAGTLAARGGRVELGALAVAGTVEFNIDSNNFHLSFPNDVARGDISFSRAIVSTNGRGGGSIQVQGKRVQLNNNSQITTTNTTGSEPGRTLAVSASEAVEIFGGSRIQTGTEGTAGDAGNLRIETGRLIVQDGSSISTTTRSTQGKGGTLFVTVRDSIHLIGTSATGVPSGLFARTVEGARDAGDIRINTGQLIVQDGAMVSASTLSGGRGGTLFVTATDSIQLNNSRSGLFVGTVATGDAGNLEIETGRLIVRDGARISASTSPESRGQGGNIIVKTGEFNVLNSADVTVSSQGSGDAGALRVNANSINLDQGKLAGTTASGRGGDISLQVQDLILMRNGSAIATTAANNGSGGNIRINAPFIVAVPAENSDILANANTGPGGRIEINATAIYGLENRTQQIPSENISEINASSDFGLDGSIEINTPDIDPNQGLINLPTEAVEPKVASGCQADASQNQSKFVITGRGGLPLNPREAFNSDTVRVDWVTLNPRNDNRDRQTVSTHSTKPTPEPIVEATGWVVNSFGEVELIANAATASPHGSWQNPVSCQGS